MIIYFENEIKHLESPLLSKDLRLRLYDLKYKRIQKKIKTKEHTAEHVTTLRVRTRL